MPRTTVNQVASQIETHEQVCGERWKNAYERFDRIEALMEAHSQRLWWIAGIIISLLLPIAYSSLF